MVNEFVNTQDLSSSAAGADATTEELSRTTAPEEKNIEKYIQTMDKLIKAMVQSTLLQKNVNKIIKDRLPKLQEALDSLVESRRATSTAHGRLKERQNITPIAHNIEAILLQYCFGIFPIFANVPSTLLYMNAIMEQCCCSP